MAAIKQQLLCPANSMQGLGACTGSLRVLFLVMSGLLNGTLERTVCSMAYACSFFSDDICLVYLGCVSSTIDDPDL